MEAESGYLSEIFRSIQGEGPRIGELHAFVRLAGCGLGCAYCDTGYASVRPDTARVTGPDGGVSELMNPVLADEAVRRTLLLDVPEGVVRAVSITGGEPLEQPGFVGSLAAGLKGRVPVMLETNGIHHEAMRGLVGLVDMVSVDIKLPSATGLGPLWDEHRAFLRLLGNVETAVKVIAGPDTPDREVAEAARMAYEEAPGCSFTIQPVSDKSGRPAVTGHRLLELYLAAGRGHPGVRVIPQSHKTLGVM